MMIFFVKWIVCYAAVMVAMCTDNLTWIPTDSKWLGMKSHFYILIVFGREYVFPKDSDGRKWCKERIKDVLTHPYDIVPGIISSLILALLFSFFF